MLSSRQARVARGGLVASFAVFVAAFSHVAGGGAPPGLLAVVVAMVFALPLSMILAGKRPSVWRLAIAVVLSQAVFHLVFSLGASSSSVMQQQGHHGAITVSSMAGMDHSSGLDGWMLVAHGCAAVLTILCLWFGERAVWQLLSTAAHRWVLALVGRIVFVAPGRIDTVATRVLSFFLVPRRDDLGVVLSSLRHRGPPASSVLI